MRIFFCLYLISQVCFGLNAESAINYHLSKSLVQKRTIESVSLIHSQKVESITKKIAFKKMKGESKAHIEPPTQYLYNKKSRAVPIRINPDLSSVDTSRINYNSVINGLENSEYELFLSESTAVGVKQSSVSVSHTY